jgi:hypothetical protein
MTPARRAAEALFSPALPREAASPAPQVIVLRRKVAAQPLAPASQGAERQPADGPRDPKIYRLQKTSSAVGPHEAEESTLGQPSTTQLPDGRRRRVREERIPSTPVVTRLKVGGDADQTVETTRSVLGPGGTSLGTLERELVQKAMQRLDETLAQVQAAASWKCCDGSLDADWQRLSRLADQTLDDIKRALEKTVSHPRIAREDAGRVAPGEQVGTPSGVERLGCLVPSRPLLHRLH